MKKNRPFISIDWQLVKAVKDGDMAGAKAALAAGASPDGTDSDGMTALHWAARNGDAVFIDFMAKAGADLHAVDDRARGALHHAAEAGKKDAAKSLLALGLSAQARDEMKDTPLHVALREGHAETAAAIWAHDPSLSLLRGQSDELPLHVAANRPGLTEMMEKLLGEKEPGGNIDENIDDGDMYRWTPLHRAVIGNNLPAVKMLVERGADISRTDVHGFTALMLAEDKEKDPENIAPYLLDAPRHRREAQERRAEAARREIERAKRELLRPFGEGVSKTVTVKKPLKVQMKPRRPPP
ncbi:MAG: hypothetical protein GC185_12750 [Alphaproteobacteria bacterium]|nr:hypothetical protein [Alphaproteobacteria bacterium]